jgi:hypothetical protein
VKAIYMTDFNIQLCFSITNTDVVMLQRLMNRSRQR